MKYLSFVVFVAFCLLLTAFFYAPDSRQAHMVFKTKVYLDIEEGDEGFSAEDLSQKYDEKIERVIKTQLAHLYGAFTNHTKPFDFETYPGIPRELPEIDRLGFSIVGSQLEIRYSYYDRVVFHQDILRQDTLDTTVIDRHGRERSARNLSFYLPRDPGLEGIKIYEKGCLSKEADPETGECIGGDDEVNRCTHQQYNSLGDFWYFWNPFQSNEEEEIAEPKACPIERQDLVLVHAKLVPIQNTGKQNPSSPDYYRLYGEDTVGKKVVNVTYLVGIDHSFSAHDEGRRVFEKAFDILTLGRKVLQKEDGPEACRDPKISWEDRPENCLFTTGELKLFGKMKPEDDTIFKAVTSNTEIKRLFGEDKPTKKQKFLQFLPKRGNYEVRVRMELFDPDDTQKIKSLGRKGLTESDVFIYDGHSGLGGYFALDGIFKEKDTLPKDKYQIFYFNGCSTFAYYNHSYFQAKADPSTDPFGIENLDILTNAIGATFTIGAGTDALLIRHLASGAKPTWIDIGDALMDIEPSESALVQVNGDETNPRFRQSDGDCPEGFNWHARSGYCRPSLERRLNPYKGYGYDF